MSNADQLKYLKMEEQIEKRKSTSVNTNDLLLTSTPQPTIKVNAQGESIFDETSLGLLDEHIRTVVRKEIKTMKDEIFREFEIYLAQRFRARSGL